MGDLYDRLILMFAEIAESCIIITQVMFKTYLSSFSANFNNSESALHKGNEDYMFYVTDKSKPKQFI
jgi:NADH:ubiquinone oxidoreductase subunit D